MMSTTARYPIKPKTLTLLELCQSIGDFRHPPPSVSSYQSSPNTAQILNRRLYLHPLTINSSGKQSLSKSSTNVTLSLDGEQRHQWNSDRNHEGHSTKTKSPHRGLAILSSSLPLTTRINPKFDTRHYRDKISVHTDDDTNSDFDVSTTATATSFNQSSLPYIARGTLSSTHTTCTRPSCTINHPKTYTKPNRFEKMNVWNQLNRTLQRPMPIDPPTTPLGSESNFNIENDELKNQYLNYSSIQELKIYKRNYINKSSVLDEDNNYDDYIYNEY